MATINKGQKRQGSSKVPREPDRSGRTRAKGSARHVVPLRDLLELEGWCFQFASQNDGSTELKASNSRSPQCWTIRAADEDAALLELARQTGWKMGN